MSRIWACSTPFGITDYIGRRHALRRCRESSCVQRLSASRIISALGDAAAGKVWCYGCSTPFGITDYIGDTLLVTADETGMCSTPFGITDYIGRAGGSSCAARCRGVQRLSASRIISAAGPAGRRRHARRVFNAFRHHGLYRRSPGSAAPLRRRHCVQRLSASRIISVSAATAPPLVAGTSVQRLSASRIISDETHSAGGGLAHDKCSTPFGITDYIGRPCAPAGSGTRSGVQRLSASRIISVGQRHAEALALLHVFNAFRHHGLYRIDCSAAIRGVKPAVFNAFRHHGLYRPGPAGRGSTSRKCSTPFGITDYIGPVPYEIARDRGHVFNAFRHHGLYRINRFASSRTPSGACSTPFGITDYIGRGQELESDRHDIVFNAFRHHGLYRRRHRGRHRLGAEVFNAFRHHGLYRRTILLDLLHRGIRCSTPFGITDYIGPVPHKVPRDRRHVFNAFRHHGLYRTPGSPSRARNSDMCSTPFGITDYIGRGPAVGQPSPHECSTPFGITDYIGRGAPRRQRPDRRPVFNAFRHHGLYRTRGG